METKDTHRIPKYIFVTGGVASGLGKGITAASIGRLLISRGIKVTMQKLDPYINVDPGTMSPYEHGEVFVTDDGAETDLDIGHYERFLGRNLNRESNHTMGKIYLNVIAKEREGGYGGKTIQVVPHITNKIKDVMRAAACDDDDVVIIEIGGTVGDMEQMVHIEAIRQFRKELGPGNSLSIHVTLIPYLSVSDEIKTKPTQNAIRDISQLGVFPDVVVCRTNSHVDLDKETREKIAMFGNLESYKDVIQNKDCDTIYEVPVMLKEQGLDDIVLKKLHMTARKGNMTEWKNMVKDLLEKHPAKTVAIVGRFVAVPDAYLSVIEALKHAGVNYKTTINVKLVDCQEIEKRGAKATINGADGIVIAGSFGDFSIEGKVLAAQYARENNIPFLGVSLGMQVAVIEFARNVAGLEKANSAEFDEKSPYPVVAKGPIQPLRIGQYECSLVKDTLCASLYGVPKANERHRHRYEFNNEYREQLGKAGLVVSGINRSNNLVEIVELPKHPYYVASLFHPEFLSRPYSPHPLYVGLIKAMKETK